MKKIIAFGLLVVVGILAIVLLTNQVNEKKLGGSPYDKEDLHQETINLIGDENYSNIVTPSELDERLEKGGEFVGYFFSPTCEYCIEMTPMLMPILKEEGIEVHQYNLLEYAEEAVKFQVTGLRSMVYV